MAVDAHNDIRIENRGDDIVVVARITPPEWTIGVTVDEWRAAFTEALKAELTDCVLRANQRAVESFPLREGADRP